MHECLLTHRIVGRIQHHKQFHQLGRLQPDEAVDLWLNIKEPGPGGLRVRAAPLNLSYAESFTLRYPDAYERLLMDVARGNLSEALGNLSRVLRDRKKMKAKIQAMSMEAKASAVIIAALPFAVMILVYISSPNYIELLWTHPTGRLMMACCAVWMLMGVMVMKKMINFDF